MIGKGASINNDSIGSGGVVIRSARLADASALLEIYRPFVEKTSTSFETEVPSLVQFSQRIEAALLHWGWLVAQVNGQLAGYAYGSTHRARRAYQWSVETSAYIDPDYHRHGIARSLYEALFVLLKDRGFGNAYAAITLPNDASISFHRSLGFEPIGVFPRVGRKFGQWHDVAWFGRVIQDSVDDEKLIG